MAHPMAGSIDKMKSDKLHRMTRDYGSADPASNISGPTNRATQEGPQEASGFGDNGSAPKARSDRASRKPKGVLANPMPTYATGGAVNRARGGRTKHKGSAHVNVIVAPQGGAPGAAAGGPPMPIGGPAGAPPSPPMAPPPHPPMLPPGAMGAPGGVGPGPMPPSGGMPGLRAGGGRTYAKGGAVHSDEKQDKALIEKTLKDEGLKPARAKGGKVGHYDAGAMSGLGRLEKIKNYGKRSHEKHQPV